MRWILAGFLAAAIALFGGSLWVRQYVNEPAYANPPSQPPASHLHAVAGGNGLQVCVNSRSLTPPHERSSWWVDGHVIVDANPDAVTALWLPGLTNDPCLEQITHGDKAVAVILAHDIRIATYVQPGTYGCPSDDGSGVILYFAYPGGQPSEVVDAGLTGCAEIDAPGGRPRWMSDEFKSEVERIAPPQIGNQ